MPSKAQSRDTREIASEAVLGAFLSPVGRTLKLILDHKSYTKAHQRIDAQQGTRGSPFSGLSSAPVTPRYTAAGDGGSVISSVCQKSEDGSPAQT